MDDTERIAPDEDIQLLTPLTEYNATLITKGTRVTEDEPPFPKHLGYMDLDAPPLTQSTFKSSPSPDDSVNCETGKELHNQIDELPDTGNINDMWIDMEQNLDGIDLDNDDLEYQKAKAAFEAEVNPSLESEIRFRKIEIKDQMRRSRMKLREVNGRLENNAPAHTFSLDDHEDEFQGQEMEEIVEMNDGQQNGDEQFGLFCSDDEDFDTPMDLAGYNFPENTTALLVAPENPTVSNKGAKPKGGSTRKCRPKRGTTPPGQRTAKNGDKNKNKKVCTSRVRKHAGPPKRQRKARKGKTLSNMNFESIFSSNLVEKAKENRSKPVLPKVSATNKKDYLKELVSAIPTSDGATVTGDRRAIMGASLKFTRKPRADGNGGWKHPDMTTSLFHYQLLGVGFMRDRENVTAKPKGGLLCDEMGFGRSIQAIANMVDGKAPPDSKESGVTLIVAPPHLTTHWKNQLLEHVKPRVLGHIIMYCSREKTDLDLFIQSGGLKTVGVIITTYREVLTSCKFPLPATTDKNEQMKWKLQNCGPLHRIRFRRIYLDEAHEIKNYLTKTSKAVRFLSAKFRWVISGTPIHNYLFTFISSIKEFYPYFDFLDVPGMDNFEIFSKKLIQDEPGNRCLRNYLRAYMLRRTHEESLFGLPLLDLPDIDENTITTKFSIVERFVYNQIVNNFMVNNFYQIRTAEGNKQYLVLLLKLRMFTSHMLLSQDFIQDAMTLPIMEELGALVAQNPQSENVEMYVLLKRLLANEAFSPGAPPTGEKRGKPTSLAEAFQDTLNNPDASDTFRENPETRVLISSLRTGGTGLDLTVATKCLLVDLWWNEAIEQQVTNTSAFCRLFRIGQKKDVEVVRICVEDTVDDRIQLLQNKKTAHIEGAMGSKVLAGRDTLEDVLKLFNMVEDENSETGFAYLSGKGSGTKKPVAECSEDEDNHCEEFDDHTDNRPGGVDGNTEGKPGTARSQDEYFDLGSYHRPVSTSSPDAQTWFDRGLIWSYAFNHDEAAQCFQRAIEIDPDCAMAYWGLAYSSGPNYNMPWAFFNAKQLGEVVNKTHTAALQAEAKAKAPTVSAVEKALTKALTFRYPQEHPAEDCSVWNKGYAEAMKLVYQEFPDDLDVATLYVDALMNLTPWKLWDLVTGHPAKGAHTLEAKDILDRALAQEGGLAHPGLLHLYIHLLEMSTSPETALPPANRLRRLVPDSGHLEHMPSHIDILCGDYQNAVKSNSDAIVADEKFAPQDGKLNFYTLYRCHNYHFKIYAAMFSGQSKISLDTIAQMEANIPEQGLRESPAMANLLESFVAMRVHVLIRFGMWEDIIALEIPEDRKLYCVTTAMRLYGKGVAYAATGNIEKAREAREAFHEAMKCVLPKRMVFNNTCGDILAVASAMLDGELEYRLGNYDAAFDHLRRSIKLYDSLHYDEPWGWMQPTRHAYGALLLERGHIQEAAAAYSADLGLDNTVPRALQHPNNVWALHGYHECLEALGKVDEAAKVGQQLATALALTDVPIRSSCFCRLRNVAARI
ncbi:TPR domain-containing protein [Arthroderma uncinatum]|uniref:TPR domain-containing protein n=1 Tax=Arthroderma uncinatum TaxID=74035 RepID=UPI00144A95FE|nr:TPR domain-containing protein [Arthroderma uncinatum]KAF3483061.1 TPR domain-containing protein [Arthroderma uncinatum]